MTSEGLILFIDSIIINYYNLNVFGSCFSKLWSVNHLWFDTSVRCPINKHFVADIKRYCEKIES